jgi:hypothetical protein
MGRVKRCVAAALLLASGRARASDHLDTPTVIADPAADIADLYAWTAADGKRLDLVLTVVGKQFSDRLQYAFHVDSGPRLGATTASTTIVCRFDARQIAECWLGDLDHARGDASQPAGLVGDRHRFRVFAGLRDDPFFNNVKGTRAALNLAGAALGMGVARDAATCPAFDDATSRAMFDAWQHTEGGPAKNLLAGWTLSTLVVEVDLDAINAGGPLIAVWAGTYAP